MPFRDVLHEADASTLAGVCDYTERFSITWPCPKRFGQLWDAVAVHSAHLPTERREFFIQGFVGADVASMTGDLERIVINNGRQVIQSVMSCGHRGFPIGAFGQFAVAEQRENAERSG